MEISTKRQTATHIRACKEKFKNQRNYFYIMEIKKDLMDSREIVNKTHEKIANL